MADYIDRQAVIDMFQRNAYDDWNQGVSTTWANAFSECADMVDDIPSADVQPVHHGHWIIPRFGADARCSVCGFYFTDAYDMENEDNYCRHCGARMDGD